MAIRWRFCRRRWTSSISAVGWSKGLATVTAARAGGRRSIQCLLRRRPSTLEPVACCRDVFKALILQGQHNLSDARMEFMIRDRLSWMRFLGLSLGDRTPDENTIRHFRNRKTETGTLDKRSSWGCPVGLRCALQANGTVRPNE